MLFPFSVTGCGWRESRFKDASVDHTAHLYSARVCEWTGQHLSLSGRKSPVVCSLLPHARSCLSFRPFHLALPGSSGIPPGQTMLHILGLWLSRTVREHLCSTFNIFRLLMPTVRQSDLWADVFQRDCKSLGLHHGGGVGGLKIDAHCAVIEIHPCPAHALVNGCPGWVPSAPLCMCMCAHCVTM